MKRILIAGIGNIFFGDDAFGVEVARKLERVELPPAVEVKDFGIRGYDLACAISGGCDAAILVDAMPRGELPGTVFLMEPDLTNLGETPTALDGHGLEPVRALQMAAAFGGVPPRVCVVGCEPADVGAEEGRMGLSDVVQLAVPRAVEMIQRIVEELLEKQTTPGLAPAGKE